MSTDPTTWASLGREVEARLRDADHEAAAQEARWIVEAASGHEGAEHVAVADQVPPQRGVAAVDRMVERRLAGEPIQYVLGRWSFRTLDLFVDHRVLIPRPETEIVAGHALAEADRRRAAGASPVLVADLGTGSGAIGMAIAAERDWTEVWLTDASPEALDVARANLAGLGQPAARVTVAEGAWFAALPDDARGSLDVIVSNPPYIAADEALPRSVVDWEPAAALVAGPAGTEDLEHLIDEARTWLAPGGALVLELAPHQAEPMADRLTRQGYTAVRVEADLAGLERVVVGRVPDPAPSAAIATLRAGGAVVVPTDTVYGVAVRADLPGAVERLAELKDRAAEQPVAVLVASIEQAGAVGVLSDAARRLAERWWPGPLTLVLPRQPDLDWDLGEPADTVGVRVPDHDLVRGLAAAVGPLATTSANRHGEATPPTAAEAAAVLTGPPDLVVDGGRCAGIASTVIDATGATPVVLRAGPIELEP
jgi:release factor glutamine methyltransferase